MPEGLNKGSAVPPGVPIPCEGKLCHPVGWTLMSLPWLETAAGMGWDGMGWASPPLPGSAATLPGGGRDKPGLRCKHSLIHGTSRLQSRRKLGADKVMRIPGARRLRLISRLGSSDLASPELWLAESDPAEPPGDRVALTHVWFWQGRCCPH